MGLPGSFHPDDSVYRRDAIAIPAGCLIGWLLGSWLDRHFHTTWIAIAGIVLGAVGGFIQMITTALRYMKDNK